MASETPRSPGGPGGGVIAPVVTAMITPFTPDLDLDLEGAGRLASHLVDRGTGTILANGTTGESPTMHDEEPWKLLNAVKDAIGDRGTVMVGTGSNDTAKTVAATRRAADEGADAVLVVTPYYNRPSQRGMAEHFRAAAEATDLPVMLYDVPGRTGTELWTSTLADLAQIDNVVGVKDAAGNVAKTAETISATRGAPGGFEVWCGADELNLPLLSVGAVGVVSVAAHLVGPQIARMIEVFPTDPAEARALHLACMPVHRSMFFEPSPGPLKGALSAVGLPAGPPRPPMIEALDETVDAVLEAWRRVGGEDPT
jgi:4-hydroxy-tetrahydrodipicolinate synthase